MARFRRSKSRRSYRGTSRRFSRPRKRKGAKRIYVKLSRGGIRL